MRRWTRYSMGLMGAAAATLGAIAAVNLSIDSQSVYRDGQNQLVHEYVQKLIATPDGLSFLPLERRIKQELARTSHPDCAVTGSSRHMGLSLKTRPQLQSQCKHLINLGVSGGGLEDTLLMLDALADDPDLRHLYIGIDPWLRRDADVRWHDFRQNYTHARIRFGLREATDNDEAARLAKLENLFNGRYFLNNIAQWHHPLEYRAVTKDLHNIAPDLWVMLPDGTYIYSRTHHYENLPAPIPLYPHNYKIVKPYFETQAGEDLHTALSYFQKRGVQIHLVLTPYHPYLLGCADAAICEAMRTVEAYARKEAPCLGADIIGSYDPAKSGLTWHDFHDAMHMEVQSFVRLPTQRPDPATCGKSE